MIWCFLGNLYIVVGDFIIRGWCFYIWFICIEGIECGFLWSFLESIKFRIIIGEIWVCVKMERDLLMEY